MSLIPCPDCKQQVSDQAVSCPHCGRPTRDNDPEQDLIEVRANMQRGLEAQGGILTITSRRLRFQPHQFNVSKAKFEVDRADIDSVEAFNTLGLIPNGLRIQLSSGIAHRFIVTNRAQLLDVLSKKC
jgi:hypothetical protein